MDINTELLGQRIYDEASKDLDQFESFKIYEINFVDIFSPKKNYHVPRFYTSKGIFTVMLTLDACKKVLEKFGIIPLDSTNVVNIANISSVTVTPFEIMAHFKEGHKANVSKNNMHRIEHLIKKSLTHPSR